ncbi:M30 family zinc metallopeptidase [Cupriavidus sp. RAF12]|uniref:M30 family zinc metallopeptidase n=1 Tax=Cupriavidus sp. RAF12 TaxID=3233050 RepID=UPI003F937C94
MGRIAARTSTRTSSRIFSRNLLSRALPALTAVAALTLAACGGGGDSGSATQGPAGSPGSSGPLLVNGLDQACSAGGQCSAATAASYSGSGTGIWGRANASTAAQDVQYSISGVAGKSIAMMLTNLTGQSVAMPSVPLSSMVDASSLARLSPQALTAEADDEASRRAIGDFNRTGWIDAIQASQPMLRSMSAPPVQQSTAGLGVGATKTWYHTDATMRLATLQQQVTATDGTIVNLWVENSQFGVGANQISLTTVGTLATAFAGTGQIYDMLKDIGGPVWGPNSYGTQVVPATGQPIDIVILNFNNDGKPYGSVAYFWGLHNLSKTTDPRSNESISLYLDSETLALGGSAGMQAMKLTMAHEGTHMQNFYRRGIMMGPSYVYADWLEEMTAMQMEDFLSHSIDPTFNAISNVRFPDFYRYSSYNCNILQFTGFGTPCESYSVSGSFGGFLDRQLGLAFYKDLLTRQTADSKTALNQAIVAAQAGSSFEQQLLRWKVTTSSGMPAAKSPTGYGYPARTDGTYVLPEIDPSASVYASLRKLPVVLPSLLEAYGTFPVARSATNGVYSDKVRVPAGATLSVVVY